MRVDEPMHVNTVSNVIVSDDSSMLSELSLEKSRVLRHEIDNVIIANNMTTNILRIVI